MDFQGNDVPARFTANSGKKVSFIIGCKRSFVGLEL